MPKTPLALIATSLLLATCLFTGCAQSNPTVDTASCGEPWPGEEQVPKSGAILIGDAHGSNEAPAFFYGVVCRHVTSRPSAKTLIGLEFNADEFDPYFQNPDPAKGMKDLRNSEFWRDFGDGRSSKAMLDMTLRLMELKSRYPDRVALKALITTPGKWDHESPPLFHATYKKFHANTAFVFAGNAHTRKVPMPFQPQMNAQPSTPFGMNLAATGLKVTSINSLWGGGVLWGCPYQGECQNLPLPQRDLGPARIIVGNDQGDDSHDLAYVIPKLTTSPPVYPKNP